MKIHLRVLPPIVFITACQSYNSELETAFMEGCKTKASETDCQCLYDELSSKVAYEDFINASQNIETDKVDASFIKEKQAAVKKCIEQSTSSANDF